MYKISVPIMNASVTQETKNDYLLQMREAQVDRVFLVVCVGSFASDVIDPIFKEVEWKLRFFEENGLEAGVWLANCIGHDSGLALPDLHDSTACGYAPLVNLDGRALYGTRCPLDENFRRDFSSLVATVAKIGAKTIMLDDDFRFNLRGSSLLCACDAHVAEISKICGEPVDRELLKQKAFVGKGNPYRRAWVCAQGDSLRTLARDIRRAVDAVDPSVCVLLCGSHTMYDVDGAVPTEITKILAGENPPELRIHGAPYWHIHWPKPLPAVFEFVRCFSRMAKADGVDRLMAEGDVYPRPRCNTPASHLELFDALNRADGVTGGILKYMVDYNATPNFETGYLKRHIRNLSIAKEMEELFAEKQDWGVETPMSAHLLEEADLDLGVMSDQYPYPLAASMLAMLSIPTVPMGEGICKAVFGETARWIDLNDLKKGAFLDGIAAMILTQRGVDVGLNGDASFVEMRPTFTVSADGRNSCCTISRSARILKTGLKEGAEISVWIRADGVDSPLIYRYENAVGQRFMVFLADPMAKLYNHELYKGYLMQNAVHDGLEWIAGTAMPVSCKGNPELYVLCRRSEHSMAVGLFNCFADSVIDPEIRLDHSYASVKFVGCSGRLEGNTVYLDAPISAYAYVAFELSEDECP